MSESKERTEIVELIVAPKFAFERLDHYLVRQQVHPSRTYIQKLIKEGDIRVNERTVKAHYKIRSGDRLVCRIPAPTPLELVPEEIPLEVLYEDSSLVVLNKPAGLVMHPAPGHYTGTLVHALLAHCKDLSGIGGRERPGLVHRLDKDTSGVMVIAKTDEAHRALSAQFKQHTITRVYEALISGVPKKGHGLIELAIGRDRKERKTFSAYSARPKESVTEYKVDHRFGKLAAHVLLYPRTGRTHQLRVHLTFLGHPILGDQTYGGKKVRKVESVEIPRVMLHARTLGFHHPSTGEFQEYTKIVPSDMEQVVQALDGLTPPLVVRQS